MSYLLEKCQRLKGSAKMIAIADTQMKNEGLKKVAMSLKEHEALILKENEKDVQKAMENHMKESLVDRLRLTQTRVKDMIEGIHMIIESKDPVWKSNEVWTLENGLTISKMTVPIGVIGIIYESRPNVTVDAFSLALKSGNCILLRGSSSSIQSNKALVYAIKEGLKKSPISENVIEFIEDADRENVMEMLHLKDYIDLMIPRGGRELIQFVTNHSKIPTIETGVGNCHIFVDETADLEKSFRYYREC
jgi:glutamate-5-semialdehyde dehydrogenase